MQHRQTEQAPQNAPSGPGGVVLPPGLGPRLRRFCQFQFSDHGILRALWSNFHRVAPGVYRGNQPAPRRLAAWKARGIRTVLNLRGGRPSEAYWLYEHHAAARLGLKVVDLRLKARRLPTPEKLDQIERAFRAAERPLVMHCKSGADRSGFAAALWLLMIEGRPVSEARAQLHWRYLHFRNGPTGILDQFLDAYETAHAATGQPFMDWVHDGYDPEAITADFAAWLKGRQGIRLPRFLADGGERKEDE